MTDVGANSIALELSRRNSVDSLLKVSVSLVLTINIALLFSDWHAP